MRLVAGCKFNPALGKAQGRIVTMAFGLICGGSEIGCRRLRIVGAIEVLGAQAKPSGCPR